MGWPSTFERDAESGRATHELWQNGYEASTVRAMTERPGITRSGDCNSFSSRDELFKEALVTDFDQAPDRVRPKVLHDVIQLWLMVRGILDGLDVYQEIEDANV